MRTRWRAGRSRRDEANARLVACAGELAGVRRRLDRSSLPEHQELRQSIVALLEAFAEAPAGVHAGEPWPNAAPGLGGALLEVGRRALDAGDTDLATRVTDTVLADRPTSQAGWRLRARTMERAGDLTGAIAAHERYLGLVKRDGLGVGHRIEGLRRRRRAAEAFVRALDADAGDPADADLAVTAAELWDEGLRLAAEDRWPDARPRLGAALARLSDGGGPGLEEAMTEYVSLLARHEPGRLHRHRPLLAAYASYRRLGHQDPAPDPLRGGVRVIDVGGFRNLIAGKTVCLVANSDRVRRDRMGAEIDSYDLVVRFNSYAIEAPATGARTDIHATIHKHGFNWDRRVTIRVVFGGDQSAWRRSVRKRLVPGAQDYVGDRSLSWPVLDPALIGDTAAPGLPTTGFNMLRLLDFLDVSPRIDLIGFDFYAGAAFRVPEAMSLPVTPVHDYDHEREWVMTRARYADDMRIRLR